MLLIDANIALRYIIGDHKELALKARDMIDNNDIEMPVEVLSEVVYVLKSVYKIDRNVIYSKLLYFFEITECEIPHKASVLCGLKYYAETNLDLVDCILAGYYEVENKEIATFDTGLQKLLAKIKA
ncbi:MAG: PIN domain-containing protein [Chitinivibrionia bacterium]|nr:PIN domain-containing protein [Chitinivibrionia bacterium]